MLPCGLKGHDQSLRWCMNTLFSRTLRDVALRAIGLTGASALRLGVLRQRLAVGGP